MNPTEQVLDKAIEGLGDDLQKGDEQPKDDLKTAPLVTPEKPEEDKEPVEHEEEGYTADDLEKDDEPEEQAEIKTEIDTTSLDPEAKYIVDNLPFITTRIKQGNSVKEVQIKSWTQLPEDVEFATKRDELAFMNSITAQENRAVSLQNQYRQNNQQTQAKEFEQRETVSIREDIARLQKAGDLPKFKTPVDDPKFSDDPATQEVQKVIDLLDERNRQYLKEYEQGRPYKHIGFEEAFHMFKRINPQHSEAEKQEDVERKKIAKETNNNRGLSSRELKKPTVKSGTRVDDILNRIDAEW